MRRHLADISQGMLAEKIGIKQGQVSAWENGRTMPTVDRAIQLCIVFGCSLDEIFCEELAAARSCESVTTTT